MPLHFTTKQTWELFLKTIIKDSEIKVTVVDNQDVTFTANVETIRSLHNLLAEPDSLKERVVHAVNHRKKETNSDTASVTALLQEQAIPEYYNDLPVALLNKLLDPTYTATDIGLEKKTSLTEFQYDDVRSVAKLHLEGSKGSVQRDTGKLKMLMDSLPDVSTALRILHNERDPVNEEPANPSELSSRIFKITINEPPTSADIFYNHGLLLQILQQEEG
ncbi:MAG: hypothetical protein LN588_04715 [Rickettsia endosymbiont of Bryobia graminum]|nr:hypothetical protein [Rickettsia endosymbiont of Bryobia graminum]